MTASIIWATALSALSFLAANAYAACLLSLPGNPIANGRFRAPLLGAGRARA